MWNYEKRLQFPVNIKKPDARAAMVVMSQYGGPDGELGASLRYLSQRYSMPYSDITGLLTDIGISCQKDTFYYSINAVQVNPVANRSSVFSLPKTVILSSSPL